MQQILQSALARRYGVAAFNIVNDLTMEAVLQAAEQRRSPVIVQVSVKTVRQLGARRIRLLFQELADSLAVPATLHLDHCPDRAVIGECIAEGWNSVLFDASSLSYEENLRQTREVVEQAHRHGVAVEGELEAIQGVEDGLGNDAQSAIVELPLAVDFIRHTGVDCFAPAIGTAHGLYRGEPRIDFNRVREIASATGIPIVIHGGTGLQPAVFAELIHLGAAKLNVSTQLKITLMDSMRDYLCRKPDSHDPLALFSHTRAAVESMAASFLDTFGSSGQAACAL